MTLAQLDIFNPSILNYAERFINKYTEPNSFDRTSNLNDSFENGFYSIDNLIELLSSLDLIKMTSEGNHITFAEDKHLTAMQRLVLSGIQSNRPEWIGFFRIGTKSLTDESVGSNIFQCLQQCGIFDDVMTKEAEEFFFKAKAIAYQKVEDTYENIRIGARGEKLSIAYEEKITGRRPEHTSLIDDTAGFDLRSIAANGSEKRIEVKASNSMRAFITWNEWKTAQQSINLDIAYEFHFWNLASEEPTLAIIKPSQLDFIPEQHKDNHSFDRYQVNLNAFKESFQNV
tara:strand:- start:856 stop:1713 length:858 start_codon:yes stop_codon:yes gene_type:complete